MPGTYQYTIAGSGGDASKTKVYTLSVMQRGTSTSLICSPIDVPVNSPTSCTVTVADNSAGSPITPSGSVTFSKDNSAAFSSLTCTLSGNGPSSATCSVPYVPTSAATQTIQANYEGDENHTSSNGNFAITVPQPIGFLATFLGIVIVAASAVVVAALLVPKLLRPRSLPQLDIQVRGGIESMSGRALRQYAIQVEVRGGVERLKGES